MQCDWVAGCHSNGCLFSSEDPLGRNKIKMYLSQLHPPPVCLERLPTDSMSSRCHGDNRLKAQSKQEIRIMVQNIVVADL